MKTTFFTLIILICCKMSIAQTIERQVIGSTGNLTNTSQIQASSNVGEVIIQTDSQVTLTITQGFEQPISDSIWIDIVSGVSEIQPEGTNISVYPNPTMSDVIVQITGNKDLEIGIEVYDVNGQLMKSPIKTKVQNNLHEKLSFSDFAAGNYFIVVKSTDGKLFRSFKVQKVR